MPPMDTMPDKDATPREVRWGDIADFDQLDERRTYRTADCV